MGLLRWAGKATLNASTLGGYSASKAAGKKMHRDLTTRGCPHCGTVSKAKFPVCPACGREKRLA